MFINDQNITRMQKVCDRFVNDMSKRFMPIEWQVI